MQPLETKRYFPKTNKYLPVWLKRSLMRSEQKSPPSCNFNKEEIKSNKVLKREESKDPYIY